MRGTLISAAVICIVICSTQPAMPGKKQKEDIKARLHSLQKIYVDGSSVAVSYIRENLSHETCLDNTQDKDEADAVLEVWEESPVSCGGANEPPETAIQPQAGVCSHIQAKLFDAKTNKLLWYLEDQHFPQMDLTHRLNGQYKWVLHNLDYSCCKGRT